MYTTEAAATPAKDLACMVLAVRQALTSAAEGILRVAPTHAYNHTDTIPYNTAQGDYSHNIDNNGNTIAFGTYYSTPLFIYLLFVHPLKRCINYLIHSQ
jgi:hypothetical protein